ncbi:hypothetical protein D5086_029525 [Populus alba]|uniref:Uncharacterized protein n=1 Tax=Populus alba TaxID=43335 RepID=A0ACC4ATR5_POPAL
MFKLTTFVTAKQKFDEAYGPAWHWDFSESKEEAIGSAAAIQENVATSSDFDSSRFDRKLCNIVSEEEEFIVVLKAEREYFTGGSSLENFERFFSNNGEARKPRKNFTSQTHHHGIAIQSVCLKLTRDCSRRIHLKLSTCGISGLPAWSTSEKMVQPQKEKNTNEEKRHEKNTNEKGLVHTVTRARTFRFASVHTWQFMMMT